MLLLLTFAIAGVVASPQLRFTPQDVAARVRIVNPSDRARTGLVRFSMPWPEGRFSEIAAVRVADSPAPCTVLERWPDGSVALTQVHAQVQIGAAEEVEWDVRPAEDVTIEPRPGGFVFPAALPVVVELADPWGRRFEATLRPDPAGEIETWASTPWIRVRRLRGLLVRDTADGTEGFYAIAAWLSEFAGERRAELTLVLDADPRDGEPVLGPARFRSLAVRVDDPRWRMLPRFRAAMLLPPPEVAPGLGFRQTLLGPLDALYLGDRTAKAFRFDVLLDGEPADDALLERARIAVEEPLVALPELAWVRTTGAFGAHGGPGPVVALEANLLRLFGTEVLDGLEGGPFGGFGDPRDADADGARRFGPFVLQDILRARLEPAQLRRVELLGLQQALRPTPTTEPRLPAETGLLRHGLSPRAIRHPHGFAACAYESFTVDLLHDVYWLTGDPLARHQIARLGSAIQPMLRTLAFRTSRGEGLAMQAAVLVARVTGDRAAVDALLDRFHRELAEELDVGDTRQAHAIAQPPHLDALGLEHRFDAPVQMAILVHGLHALWRASADPEVRDAALCVARRLADRAWIDGRGPAAFVSAREPGVRVAAAVPPDAEVDAVIASALALAAELAGGSDEGRHLLERAAECARLARSVPSSDVADRWLQLYFDRSDPAR